MSIQPHQKRPLSDEFASRVAHAYTTQRIALRVNTGLCGIASLYAIAGTKKRKPLYYFHAGIIFCSAITCDMFVYVLSQNYLKKVCHEFKDPSLSHQEQINNQKNAIDHAKALTLHDDPIEAIMYFVENIV